MATKTFFWIVLILLGFAGGPSWGASQTIAAAMRFETALSLTNVTDVNLGTLVAGTAGTYTISPAGTVTATHSGVFLGGATQAGGMTIAGSTTQTIDVSATNYTAHNGVTPSNATCAYDGGAASPCSLAGLSAPGAGKSLKVGVTVAVDGTQAINTAAAPTFDIVVNYN